MKAIRTLFLFPILLFAFALLVDIASAKVKITGADAIFEGNVQSVSISTQAIPVTGLFINGADAVSTRDLSTFSISTQPVPIVKLFVNNEDAILTKDLLTLSVRTQPISITRLFIFNADAILTKALVPFTFDTEASVPPQLVITDDTEADSTSRIESGRTTQEESVEVPVLQRWAVLIGVSSYRDSRIPSLRYAHRDAQAFHDWLVSPEGGEYAPDRVKLLLDEHATFENIREALFTWLKQATEEDMVVIYFSGHGSPESPDALDNLFLLPYDADYDKIRTTGFPMWDIETALKRDIRAKKVVVIADACHAGGVGSEFVDLRKGFVLKPRINTALHGLAKVGDGVAVLTASDDKQFSQESQKWGGGHGVFTWFLLEGLKGEADYNEDKRVTLGELIPYLSEQVRRETRNSQSPTVAGKFDPAITIGK
jgi:hypothetical protein